MLIASSILIRPADTVPYALNDAIASSVTAGSVVVPSLSLPRSVARTGQLRRVRLLSNVTTGWGAVVIQLRLWANAPTYSVGDNGAYAVATGAAQHLGALVVTLEQFADGAVGFTVPTTGAEIISGSEQIYWDMKITTGTPTPISGQTFTLIGEFQEK